VADPANSHSVDVMRAMTGVQTQGVDMIMHLERPAGSEREARSTSATTIATAPVDRSADPRCVHVIRGG
jgi:hypothetical protein